MRLVFLAVVLISCLAPQLSAVDVVGFPQPFDDIFVAVRKELSTNIVVTGVRFLSNDSTTFPEVSLALDAGGDQTSIPHFAESLRSEVNVASQPGYTSVDFEPCSIEAGMALWVILRFPNEAVITGAGLGGGAGVGWLSIEQPDERFFFGTAEELHEFSAAFDITLLTETAGKASLARPPGEGYDESPETRNLEEKRLKIKRMESGDEILTFVLKVPQHTRLSIYDVRGRRVRSMHEGVLPPGPHEFIWNGKNDLGRELSNGVYFVALRSPAFQHYEKVVRMR